MSLRQDPRQNHILDALPQLERERLFPHLKLVPLPLGMVLYESGAALRHIYFPTNSIVSLLYVMQDGASAEIAVVGNEGVIGVSLFMGGETTPSRAIVQSAGYAYRLTGRPPQAGIHPPRRIAPHSSALHAILADTDVADRGVQPPSHIGPATVSLAAAVARSTVGKPAEHDTGAHRKHAGRAPRGRHRRGRQAAETRVIRYSRGKITVLDRPKLERLSCECYAVVKRESDRLEAPYRRPRAVLQ